jgi:hypothetical protein
MTDELAQLLNKDCFCIAVDKKELRHSLNANLRDSGLPEQLLDSNSHLFADSPVFVQRKHLQEMERLIAAVEHVAQNAAYRDKVLAAAPASARQDHGPGGVFFGYDFHLGEDGPQLIEINTNAGGILLSLHLASAQQACCAQVTMFFGGKKTLAEAEDDLIAMFREEWNSQRQGRALQTIAIVDEKPESQFLYPELLLFQSLFRRHGIEAIIADPTEFRIDGNALHVDGQQIDLVYNRLTDFYLEMPESACLLEAYRRDIAVLTPSPHVYALYADKRNLPLLSDADQLKDLGVAAADIEAIDRSLPTTVAVSKDNAEQLWKNRKRLFFKPATGYGSRGAYRGAKLTKRVWQNITQGDYIAQAMIPPSQRQLIIDGEKQSLKLDVRCVTYSGEIQQLSARLYEGQTTNLRTSGGGLATVFATPDISLTDQ